MNRFLKPSASLLMLTLSIAGCATSPFSPPPSKAAKPAAKAPVVDRSRQPPAYSTPPSRPAQPPQVEIGQLPREDPLTPREYAPTYPATPYPAERYPTAPTPYPAPAPPARAYPPAEGGAYQPPAYPPGAAYPTPPSTPPVAAGAYEAAPVPLSEPQATPPRTPRPAIPKPEEETLALAPPAPAAPTQPVTTPPPAPAAPLPAAPPPRPADLPPAEITREGNQAVVALLDSADKYVKGGQLDKAGAALERALRIEPRNAGIWHDLAQIRLHQGQYQQAESLASKSNNLASGNRALQSRNWKLISVARKAGGNAAGAEEAEAQASLLSR
jgi:hypothetical protein